MDGTIFQGLMRENGITGPYLAEAAGLSEGSIYRYYSLETIKKQTLEKLLTAVGLTMDDWHQYRDQLAGNMQKGKTIEHLKKQTYHQGGNMEQFRIAKGISATAMAERLNIARRTYYNYVLQKELPPGVLLEAATVLGVPVAAIKGLGDNARAFEKDIYMTLQKIETRLAAIEGHLQK